MLYWSGLIGIFTFYHSTIIIINVITILSSSATKLRPSNHSEEVWLQTAVIHLI